MSVEDMVARYGTFNRMFELHHVDPKTKHHKYSQLMKRNLSAEQIDEVDKCILLCRTCHGIVHAQDLQTTLNITLTLGSNVTSQEVNGWMVIDNVDNTMKFISNKKLLLEPCWVKIGTEKEQLVCLLEIIKDKTIQKVLKDIESLKTTEVWSFDKKKLIVGFKYIKKNLVNIKFSLGFDLFKMDFSVDEDSNYLWLRNGIILTKEGEVVTKGIIECPMTLAV